MTGQTLPPLRGTHQWRGPGGLWCYDTWGRHGRPLLLIPPVLFDRAIWWPAAAELRPDATVVAVDLPGHGGSARRPCYRPDDLVDELAALLAHLGARQAPVLVAHGASAGLAARFATRYATRAVVVLDPDPRPDPDPARYLRALGLPGVPQEYRGLAEPVADPRLLAGYHASGTGWPAAGARPASRHLRLAAHSRPPAAAHVAALPGWQHAVYHLPGRVPQLTGVDRVVRDIRALL